MSNISRKRVGDRIYPCVTPLLTFVKSESFPQELMIGSKHLKHQQDYFSSVVDKINNNVDNKVNYENLSTFHYYVQQNYIHPSSSLVFKTSSTKDICL